MSSAGICHIRPLDASSPAEIDLVASRMRETLVEVLGEERGTNLYTMEWLRDRVRFHLDPERSTAAIFLSEDAGCITGHTIVRVERENGRKEIGLFSTIFVQRPSRRMGIANGLVLRGEEWMLEHGLAEAVTYTSDSNVKLINLYRKHGYEIVAAKSEMVKLAKPLPGVGEDSRA